jgi:predicted aspartyl protease
MLLLHLSLTLCISVFCTIYSWTAPTPLEAPWGELAALAWPEGTQLLPFEDAEGAILVRATLRSTGGRDTSGLMLLDTGAGYLALDLGLARILGLADSAAAAAAVDVVSRPLPRLELGSIQIDQVSPVISVDAGVVRRVTGRPVLGLLGQALLRDRVVVLDYSCRVLALLPPEAVPAAEAPGLHPALSARSVPVPFRLAGDGKILLRARVTASHGYAPTELSLILDTGATKTVFFREALDRRLPGWRRWSSLTGLGAPTLTGDARAEIVRVPGIEVGPRAGSVARSGMDAAVLGGELHGLLEAAVREPVDGLLGYSFLKHFRIAIDYPRGVLWLDPERGDVPDRSGEYCHPGIQLESVRGSLRVMGVVTGSPAALAGIRTGDELLSVDGARVSGDDVVAVARKLEGEPGSGVVLRLRRGSREWSRRVVRTRLL